VELPVPVVVTTYDPVGVELVVQTVRVDVAVPPDGTETTVGLKLVDGPAGEIVDVRLTLPLNPLTLVTVIVEVAQEPWMMLMTLGLAAMVKSGGGGLVVKEAP